MDLLYNFNMIKRIIYDKIDESFKNYRIIVLNGPRQAGKTTLVKEYISKFSFKSKYVTGDDVRVEEVFSSRNLDTIKDFVYGYDLVVIDEAQRIKNIGLSLKLAVDNIENIKFIITGSSSFELIGEVGEPLVGRKKTLNLFPLNIYEIRTVYNNFEIKEKLEEFMIFGTYPKVFTAQSKNEKIDIINEITNSYLLRDVLKFEGIKKSSFILKILRLLAFQIGNEVSLNEIANNCNLDVKTVMKYLDLLEKSFIIYEIGAFAKNPRKEIVKKKKYYFYDNGVINSLISNFNSLELRNDAGRLWENFIFMERLKKNRYSESYVNMYFWRSKSGSEIDIVEEKDGSINAYEFKFSEEKIKKITDWGKNYKSDVKIINKFNFTDFV
jgi:predicted AAA+ superfamily ATPase